MRASGDVLRVGLSVGWVRRHRRNGAVLALIALALEIAVAFGHVHLPALARNPCAPSAAGVALAGSKPDAPAPPQLLVPANFQRVEHSLNSARSLADSLRLAFRSRAPPVA